MSQPPSSKTGGIAGELRSATAPDGVAIAYEVARQRPASGPVARRLCRVRVNSRASEVLAERYRLIIPSSRGHDGSDWTLPVNCGSTPVRWTTFALVVDAENIDQTHVVGHSSGGATAFAFARRFPQRLDRLVLVEPTLIGLLLPQERDAIMALFQAVIDRKARRGPRSVARHLGVGWRRGVGES